MTSSIAVLQALARHAAHDVGEHLHEAPVGVPGEPFVAGGAGETFDRLIVEPEVEHRIEHPGHRLARPRAHRDEQRILDVAEAAAGAPSSCVERRVDLHLETVRILASAVHVRDARLGRDRESRRHPLGAEHACHLGDVGALASEQLAHLARAFAELIDVLVSGHSASLKAVVRYVRVNPAA